MASDPFDESTLDTIADAPEPRRPALTFVAAQLQAEHAARAGVALHRAGQYEMALARVSALAEQVGPAARDTSPGGRARLGLQHGIVDTWQGQPFVRELNLAEDAELYTAAYALATAAVYRVITTEMTR